MGSSRKLNEERGEFNTECTEEERPAADGRPYKG